MADQSSSISTTGAGSDTVPSKVWRVPLPPDIDYNLEFAITVGGTRGLRIRDCIDVCYGKPMRPYKDSPVQSVDQAELNIHRIQGVFTPRGTVMVQRVLFPFEHPRTVIRAREYGDRSSTELSLRKLIWMTVFELGLARDKASTLLSGNFDDWDSLYLVAIRGTIPDKEGVVRWVPELEVRRCGEHMEEACLLEDASPEVMQDVRWVGNYIKRCEAWRRAGGTL